MPARTAASRTRSSTRPARSARIAWSPDGRHLAWIGHRRGEVHGINFELWVLEVDVEDGRAAGSPRSWRPTSIARSGSSSARDPPGPFLPSDLAWTPDGRGLYVIYLEGGTSPLARIGLDDSVEIVAGGERGVYGFAVGSERRDRDRRRRARRPGQISLLAPGGAPERPITDLNRRWKESRLGRAQ